MRSILSRCSSVKGLSGRNGDGSGRTHLYLNVYDLTPANNYLYWFGIGVFHSGIEGMPHAWSEIFRIWEFLFIMDSEHTITRLVEYLRWNRKAVPVLSSDGLCGWVTAVGQLPANPAFSGEFCHTSNYQISLFTYLVAEDGSVSYASSSIDESDEEDADHHLLKKPNGDFVHSNDVPLRIGRDDI
ncbi:hypothetical protein BHE74_00051476 [Ensete ventricosum]|nr:hypothetical protein GW17_00026539 [Ensete ventricosum]RWW42925.1 hypothetical protein BHE74_00051476 [Ensete ventricosum]